MPAWQTRVARTTGNIIVETVPFRERVAVLDASTKPFRILFLKEGCSEAEARRVASRDGR